MSPPAFFVILPIFFSFFLHLSADKTEDLVSRDFFPMEGDLTWIVQVSDLHLSAFHPKRAEDLARVLGSAIRVIRPDLLLVTGDITVLVALLDSHYTDELIEKALLQTLEETVGRNNITFFVPRNESMEHDLDPDLKRFLLEPRNLKSLQTLILLHFEMAGGGVGEKKMETGGRGKGRG